MKRDIQKAVEEIKSAGMEEFLHQDPSKFDCDDNKFSGHKCTTSCKCPRTKCTRVKKCTFITKCTRVKKCTFVTKRTRVRVQKWTFVTKVTRVKKCTFVTKRTRVKKCFCKKCVFIRNHDKKSCDHSWDDDCHSSCHDCDHHKHSSCKRKKCDHFWFRKRNC
ncbi:CotG/ExsB N-terminal domain-containing protein [Bacillus pseudomycoides]|uniref:CotG/ExsB N-terminal domain-containing protein n=1 Tax=Bacillus pseudomycoides TaxID=64104 RepID=UPI000BF79557|nr:spore coat protein G [Bacillus pseudomycoides]PGA20001.1 spore coat protein G [Bacillus pseudomycoides]PHB40516.1 spore coat protein G [Bacillus pseudomycoides]